VLKLNKRDTETLKQAMQMGILSQQEFIDCHAHIEDWPERRAEKGRLERFENLLARIESKTTERTIESAEAE
jgi:hypothetical protein